MPLSVIGLGRLGAPMAAVMAEKGHRVIGVDVNPAVIKSVNSGQAPVNEPGLAALVARNHDHLSATGSVKQAVTDTDVTFIIVPTPSEPDGTYSLRYVLDVAESVGHVVRAKSAYHVVVLSSTVMPGATGGKILPLLEKISGKRCGVDFGLCYHPKFAALGTAISDLLHPDIILIGEHDQRCGGIVADLCRDLCESRPKICRMNFVNAELTKLSVNTFVTTKISYANMLAQLCETLPGADVDVVTDALGNDSRIGSKYLRGALGYGGPCFPRDNGAFAALARERGAAAALVEATDEQNRRQVPRLAELILKRLSRSGVVGIAGLSYKPETNVVEDSQGLHLAKYLLAKGVTVIVYDPMAMENARSHLAGKVTLAGSLEQCTGQANVLVITTPWEQFKSISPRDLNYSSGLPTVVDCWRILPRDKFEKAADYVTLGLGVEQDGAGTAASDVGEIALASLSGQGN